MRHSDDLFRILVIDDTPSIHHDIRKVLNRAPSPAVADLDALESDLFGAAQPALPTPRFEIDSAYQGEQGLQKVIAAREAAHPYAIAIVDMRMPPGWDGVRTIRELWAVEPTLQVMICTAYSDYSPEQVASELHLDGRMLIIRKPFDAGELRQLTAALCDKWQLSLRQTQLAALFEKRTEELKRATLRDPMTGLGNRVLFGERLAQNLERAARDSRHRFGLLYVDVDNFKGLNDRFGHKTGDLVLQEIASRLNTALRQSDTVARVNTAQEPADGNLTARLGGDEFAVILEDIRDATDAAFVARRLLEAVKAPFMVRDRALQVSISIGIAVNSVAYANGDEILRDADAAMARAKSEGPGRFVVFDQQMHDETAASLAFKADLRAAVEAHQIDVHYQPIIQVTTQNLAGFEALARWTHPTRGAVPPMQFIPAAEESDLIVTIGIQVLEKACRQLAHWQKSLPGAANYYMSVNLSRRQLECPNLVEEISRVLRETGIRPQSLKLEITESCIMTDAPAAIEVLRRIRELHVELHIDDFGTGYSTLSCLQSLPLDGLKIDRSFVRRLTDNPGDDALLRAIIALAHSMNLPLVSEGVETPDQAARLQAMGCDFAQGYLFSKPMSAEATLNFIQQRQPQRSAA